MVDNAYASNFHSVYMHVAVPHAVWIDSTCKLLCQHQHCLILVKLARTDNFY